VPDELRVRLPAPRTPPHVAIRLLGTFALDVDGATVSLPTGAQRLVAVVALRGRLGRSRLAGLLWPGTIQHRALASLRTGIWRVNQAAPGLVVSSQGIVELGLRPEVDVDRLIEVSRAVLEGRETLADPTDAGGGTGELLPDWDDAWLEQERERLRQLRLHVLEATATRLTEEGRFGMALESALAALRADDLRESAHRVVISIHLAEGNVVEARRAYDHCCRTLRDELGIEPSARVARLLDDWADSVGLHAVASRHPQMSEARRASLRRSNPGANAEVLQ